MVDMNLSPEWLEVFAQAGWQARHWSQIGRPNADDDEIFSWAAENGQLVFTQDLDFPQILFASQGGRPSVVLLRIKNELDAVQRARVCAAIRQAVRESANRRNHGHRRPADPSAHSAGQNLTPSTL